MGDVDILSIDSEIITGFNQNLEKLEEYHEKLIRIQGALSLPNLSHRIRDSLYKNWEELKNLIDDIKTSASHNFYIMETTEMLDGYKKLLKNPIKINFMGKKDDSNEEKSKIISEYLKIAKKYQKNLDIHTKNFRGHG